MKGGNGEDSKRHVGDNGNKYKDVKVLRWNWSVKPIELTAAGYRLYDNKALERLQEIMFFKELEILLEDIKKLWTILIMTESSPY